MTISQLIAYVDSVKPNQFDAVAKVAWLNEVEGMVWTEVLLLSSVEFKPYSYNEETGEGDTELIVKEPHTKLYGYYMTAMVDYHNGEYDKYDNTMAMFNSAFGEYQRWYAMNYRPADGNKGYLGTYITAYGIALKHGFVGTEEEWLESLRGETGKSSYEAATENGYEGTEQQFGKDQAEFEKNAASVREDKESAESAKTEAGKSASDAETFAGEAKQARTESAQNAAAAYDFARQAEISKENAERVLQNVQNKSAAQITAIQNEGEAQRRALEESVAEQQNRAETAAEEADAAAQRAKESEENASQRIAEEAKAQISDIKETGENEFGKFEAQAKTLVDAAMAWGVKAETEANRAAEEAAKAEASVSNGAYIVVSVGEDGNLYMEKTENADEIDLFLDKNGNLYMEVNKL